MTAQSAHGAPSAAAILAIAIAVLIVGYVLSLFLHPQTSCRACSGRGRNRGFVYRYSIGACGRCGGSGRKERLGTRVLRNRT
ncbi:MAG TPA: hypothetical protein VHC49_13520 [Mycobacteriales bacterium]|nr:hypothetical protein [Mycobacteriales bacterium]